jgi:hypothetical protein
MSPELDEALCKAHPELFRERRASMRDTAMCWGFECGDGWYGIIASLCELICLPYEQARQDYEYAVKCRQNPELEGHIVPDEEVERSRLEMVAAQQALPCVKQVKEKFGTLRFYLDSAEPRTSALVEFAEYHSSKVCEECGCPGVTRSTGWLRTLCDRHAAGSVPTVEE